MPRLDLYTPIHKAIRSVLFDTAAALGRTSFADADEAAAAVAALRQLFACLDEHAEHEDAVVLPELLRSAPELHAVLEAEHARLVEMQREVEQFLPRLAEASAGARPGIGQRLQHALHRLIGAHLVHLEREEVEANRALWAHFDDQGLQALHGRIMARIAPPQLTRWLRLMLPALSRVERQQVLAGLQQKPPVEVFAAVTAPARAALGEAEWLVALSVAAVPAAAVLGR